MHLTVAALPSDRFATANRLTGLRVTSARAQPAPEIRFPPRSQTMAKILRSSRSILMTLTIAGPALAGAAESAPGIRRVCTGAPLHRGPSTNSV